MSASTPYRSRPDHLIAFTREELALIDRWHPVFHLREDRYERKLRKALFFLLREGLFRTLKKKAARKRKSRLATQGVCVIARDKEGGQYYGGFQHHPEQEVFYFLPGAHWDQEPSREDLSPIEKLDPFLGHVPKGWEGTGNEGSFRAIHFQKEESEEAQKDTDLYAIGCGSYMLSEVLPIFLPHMHFRAAVDVDRKLLDHPRLKEADHRSNDLQAVMEADTAPERTKTAYIASYHSWHTAQAVDFLRYEQGRTIIEKPPCITEEDLSALCEHFDPQRVFVAFHRRYAPWNRWIRDRVREGGEPVMIDISVHESPIGPDHWYFVPDQGTRIAGNLCHWIDLAVFWIPSTPERVTVAANEHLGADRSFFSLHFADGSMVHFTANDLGDPTRGVQERIHVQGKEQEIRLDDHLKLQHWVRGKWRTHRALKRDKGHERMNRDYLQRIMEGSPSPYPKEDLIATTRIQNAFIELGREGGGTRSLDLSEPIEKARS
jgi:predicted dehydrogenase